VEDSAKIRGRVEGDVLRLEAKAGFLYTSMNKQEVLQRFADAAHSLFGREIRVQLTPMQDQQQQVREPDRKVLRTG
jgi:hypothetical protein